MTQEFEVTTEELLRTLQRRGIPLPSEIGAFITLETCEQLLDRPAEVSTHDVIINEVGEVLCAQKLPAAPEPEAVRSLLSLLGDLLVCAAPGVPNMLLDLVEHGPNESQRSLQRLLSDLEACLLPLNRGATRRVLSRLVREAKKPGPSVRSPSPRPAAAEVDAAFDALMGGAPASAQAKQPRALDLQSLQRNPDSKPEPAALELALTPDLSRPMPRVSRGTLNELEEREGLPPSATEEPTLVAPPDSAALSSKDERDPTVPRAAPAAGNSTTQPVRRRPASARAKSPVDFDLMVEAQAQRGRLGLWVFAISTTAALGLLLAYFALGRDQARSALGLLPREAPQPTAAKAPAKEKRAYGDLRVNSQPAQAQVLLLLGKGPALATDIPLGVAQEFVALAPGYAPTRALLPADAQWDELDGQPRYELAMQAKALAPNKKVPPLGATLLPHSVGAPQGRLGSVRVVTTPRGADVYQLIGFTPDVRVENLPLDRAYDVLVYLEGRPPLARHIEPADFRDEAGKRVADLKMDLPSR